MNRKAQSTPVRIVITSERYEVSASLFRSIEEELNGERAPEFLSPAEEMQMGILPGEDGKDDRVSQAEASAEQADGEGGGPESYDLYTEGRLAVRRLQNGTDMISVIYDETEISGMVGSTTAITYRQDDPGLVTMIRTGTVRTSMTFRAHHRTICTYETPYMPFQIGIHALVVDNRLACDGELVLEYITEIRGARAERCAMTIRVTAADGTPLVISGGDGALEP